MTQSFCAAFSTRAGHRSAPVGHIHFRWQYKDLMQAACFVPKSGSLVSEAQDESLQTLLMAPSKTL